MSNSWQFSLDSLDEIFKRAARLDMPRSDDQQAANINRLDSGDIVKVPSTSSVPAWSESENEAITPANKIKDLSKPPLPPKPSLQNSANKNPGKESRKQRLLTSNWRITKANNDQRNHASSKNQVHKKPQSDSFTVTGLLCQICRKGSDKWFYVKVEEEPLTGEQLKCYFRHLSDPSVPLIEYKTKFLLGVKFVNDHDQHPLSEQRTKVLWVNVLEYIKLTSSDVLKTFNQMPLLMTHEEIVQKLYFTWRPFLTSLLSQACEFDEEALIIVLDWILPRQGLRQLVDAHEHQHRFQEIIKMFSSRESSFLLRLNQLDFQRDGGLVKELIELVATTNNCLNPVCHLLRRYYGEDLEGLLNLIKRCCKGFDASLHSLATQNFRNLPLIPVMEELKGVIPVKVSGVNLDPTMQGLLQLESHLIPNRIVGPWESPEEFLNVHFRLLREECFASIRERIARVRSEPNNGQLVHRDVKLVSYAIGDGSIIVKIKFKPCKIRANLMYGNLLCLDVDTNFCNPIWATVKSSEKGNEISISLVGVGNNYISGDYIDGLDGSPSARVVVPALQRLIASQSGVMVESPTYYHAFRPVLARLQTLTSSDFPFASEILLQSTKPQPSPMKFNVTNNFSKLDASQKVAAEAALRNRFSLIQGPPGCGKTYVGKEIVRKMLGGVRIDDEDVDEEEEDVEEDELGNMKFNSYLKEHKGPILVISYKNHALDSFLESCLKFTQSLARIGGRSTSEAIAKFDLHNQTEEMKTYFSKDKFMKLQDARKQLQDFAEKVEKTAAKSLISFTPLALLDFLLNERGTNGKVQLHSLMVRNFEKNYREIIKQENYACPSPEIAVMDILNSSPVTAEKILYRALDQWLSEKMAENYLPKPQSSLFINTVPPKIRNKDDDDVEDDEEIEEDEWEQEVAERFVGSESKYKFKDISSKKVRLYQTLQKRLANLEPDGREQEVCGVNDVWSLTYEGRYVLLSYWIREWRKDMDNHLSEALEEYNNFYHQVQVLEQERNVEFLKSRDLIACTITGCCLRMGVIARVAPAIVIVEEAAEILESQLIASLPSSVKHVVLVGDHQQLPPQVHHYRLKREFNLGVSIFERLANNGYPVSQLRFHRRGPQSLCPLFARFYKQEIEATKIDPSPPPTLARMGLFYWWTHEAPAQLSPNGTSYENEFEGEMVVGAVHFLIKLGRIAGSQISIITGYQGQAKKIKQLLAKEEVQGVNVCTIDRYQGDENDYIFLSLTRSVSEKTDSEPSLGFLSSPNRICVALSRARIGLYVFGCSSLFQYHPTWTKIVQYFRQRGKLGHELPFNISGKRLSFEHPNDFSLFFKDLQLQEKAIKLKLHNRLAKELPHLNPGVHDVTAEFGRKIEDLMHDSILNKRDLGVGKDSDKQKYFGFKVMKVMRIFNKESYLVYLHHRKVIEDSKPPPLGFDVDTKAYWILPELNKKANEVCLFHGTNSKVADIICNNGFDERVANDSGMFGAGIYFAENADKSDQYTDPEGPKQIRQMFLARVTLGRHFKTKTDYKGRRPPPIDSAKLTKLHDSVIAVSSRKVVGRAALGRHQEFIVYDRYQCLPVFIIDYCRRLGALEN